MNYKILSILFASSIILGCAKHAQHFPQDFIPANRTVSDNEPKAPDLKIAATFGLGNDPEVIKAYDQFTKNGVAKNIRSKGFETFAYDAYSHPIVACAPLHLCVISLEQGERINNIELGDSAHWLISTAIMGDHQSGSYQVAVKPKIYDSATDLVITTDKRTYNIGLVSKQGAESHVINFYYPEETLNLALNKTEYQDSASSQEITSNNSVVDVDHLNFNYEIKGDVPWKPVQVFDDGTKTFIRMSAMSERLELPVLYILRNKETQLINYRYRRPYYVVDGLFQTGYLISGHGKNRQRVVINNSNFG